MKDVFVDAIEFFVPLIVGAAVVIGGVLTLTESLYKRSCTKYSEIAGMETKWVLLDACYIKTKDGWLTMKERRAALIAREGLQER